MAGIEDAAAFVDRVGVAVVWPQPDLVVPCLWGALGDPSGFDWAVRDADGSFVSFTEEAGHVWAWKDELPERGLACVGRHLGRYVAAVAPRLVAAVWALKRDEELSEVERAVADAVADGPCGGPDLRRRLGLDAKLVNRTVERLQRKCVLTSAGQVRQEHGWPAIRLDLFERHWQAELRAPPPPVEARLLLARTVLEHGGEVSAADLAAALGQPQREAAATLAQLAEAGVARSRDDAGIAVFTRA